MKYKPVLLLLLVSSLGCHLQLAQSFSWKIQAAKLSNEQRDALATMTPGVDGCSFSSWDTHELYWVCEGSNVHGPRAILPFSTAMGQFIAIQQDAQWCDPNTEVGMGDGQHEYHCVPDTSAPHGFKGRWERDLKAEKELAKWEKHRADLAHALTTRVLTDAEMREVLDQGYTILTQDGIPYDPVEVQSVYANSILIQDELRSLHLPKGYK